MKLTNKHWTKIAVILALVLAYQVGKMVEKHSLNPIIDELFFTLGEATRRNVAYRYQIQDLEATLATCWSLENNIESLIKNDLTECRHSKIIDIETGRVSINPTPDYCSGRMRGLY